MNNQNLIIYKFNPLYKILKEFDNQLNFKIIEVLDEISLNNKTKDLKNYLIVSKKKSLKNDNELVFEDLPIKLTVLMERLNVNLLKKQFNDQSEIMIGNYKIDLNSRLMSLNNLKLKLTEREVNTILYISKTSQPVSINELQTNVWEYQSDLETHTVETHIYRLRKKIFEIFNDKNFIISSQNGYEIK